MSLTEPRPTALKKILQTVIPTAFAGCICFSALSCGTKKESVSPSKNFPAPDSISVLFWNVENMFDLTENGTEYPEYRPGQNGWDRFSYETKMRNIASVLLGARTHIATLCEIENRSTAIALAQFLRDRGLDYPYVAAADTPGVQSTTPVLLSKLPIIREMSFPTVRVEEGYESRNILRADIQFGTDTLTVFVCHWPSKRHSESYRVAAAESLYVHIAELPPGRDYLIAGDLNADYNECEILTTGGFDDSEGRTGINHVLGTVQSQPYRLIDYVWKNELAACPPPCHYNVWLELPHRRRGSYTHRGRWTTPDHFLIPAALVDSTGLSYIDNSFAVYTHGDTLLRFGEPYGWQMRYKNKEKFHSAKGYSDHLPLIMRVRRGPFVAVTAELPVPPPVQERRLSFESGVEWWLGAERGVEVERDATTASSGAHSLRIEGRVGKSNATVARAVLPSWLYAKRAPSRLTMRATGKAIWCIRVRNPKHPKWHYFYAPDFKPLKSARFKEWASSGWSTIALDISGLVSATEPLEIEIRARKSELVELRLDDISIQ